MTATHLLALLEGLEVPHPEWWAGQPPEAIRSLGKAISDKIKQADLCRNGEEVAAIESEDAISTAEMHTAADRIESLDRMLCDLLAVIHRDGGQYTSQHGIEKSAGDAGAEVAKLHMMAESIDDMVDAAVAAERDACAAQLVVRSRNIKTMAGRNVYAMFAADMLLQEAERIRAKQ